ARVGLFDKPDDLLGAESALLHVRPLGFTDFIASAGTAQWGQVKSTRSIPTQPEDQNSTAPILLKLSTSTL
ncbi:hypothetical protein, partial [Xanthomonas euvesicatoria]|uniref:hypothetical protein n=1 Tax=Xanthomonas euvesicatoria TaxID=456327 RepID=UPI00359D9968